MFFDKSTSISARVTSVSDVTPNMRRFTLFSAALRNVTAAQPGQFVGVTFPGHARGEKPRRFTIRDFDSRSGSLALEFAMHGEAGIASKWAVRGQLGDELLFSKPGRGYHVDPQVRSHILIGDPTFLPAAFEIMAGLPDSCEVFAFFEVKDKHEEQRFCSSAQMNVRWVHSGKQVAGTTELLVNAVRHAALPNDNCQAWVGGESRMTRAVEQHLSNERRLSRSAINAHGYWSLR